MLCSQITLYKPSSLVKTILAKNNFFLLPSFSIDQLEVLYSPRFYSNLQKEFWEKHFDELAKVSTRVKWENDVQMSQIDIVISWDAWNEKKEYGTKLYPKQNRLFASLPFEMPESFTPFRQLAEKYLPPLFKEAVPPWDKKIQNELHYYFNERKLPLTYLETRNEMLGRDGSTKFSSYLSSGLLDVRFLYNEVKKFESIHGASKSSGWIIFELLWRDFFYWHYQKYPRHYFSKNGLRSLNFSLVPSYTRHELRKMNAHPFFHAALNELLSTGFLSNRARQIFASIWINDLQLDWRSGAKLFEENLIDFDVFSNYGNWMYLAGVGVDPRGKRYFNVDKQLETYDPKGDYLKAWKE